MNLNLDEEDRLALVFALDNYLNGIGFEEGDPYEYTLENILSALNIGGE